MIIARFRSHQTQRLQKVSKSTALPKAQTPLVPDGLFEWFLSLKTVSFRGFYRKVWYLPESIITKFCCFCAARAAAVSTSSTSD